MKTFQIKVSKSDKHRCIKFKSELSIDTVLAAVKAVVKDTYKVSIKEIHCGVSEDRNIEWAIKEAASVRFYHRVWKETIRKVPTTKLVCNMQMPRGTKVDYNCTTNTFFDICIPYEYISLDISKVNMITGLNIHTTNAGMHPFYLIGCYSIKCMEFTTFTEVAFYKIYTKVVIDGEFVTEEL